MTEAVLQHAGAAMLCALTFIVIGTVMGYLGGCEEEWHSRRVTRPPYSDLKVERGKSTAEANTGGHEREAGSLACQHDRPVELDWSIG
jgi:hypothetical protein